MIDYVNWQYSRDSLSVLPTIKSKSNSSATVNDEFDSLHGWA